MVSRLIVAGMHLGLWYAAVGPFAYPEAAVRLARDAEAAGFDSLWTGDHVAVPLDYESAYPYSENGRMPAERAIPMAEPLVWAAHLAAATTTLKLASGVLVLPQREPVLLAKQAATVAVLSQGRLILGAGTGWLREEFAILGADFDHRTTRMDEHVAAMRALWAADVADFEGTFVSFAGAQVSPRPPGDAVPIVVGGDSRAAARRAGRIGDGWFPAQATTEALPRLADLAHKAAADTGRDPAALEITVHDPSLWDVHTAAERIAAWRDLGVHRVLLSPNTFDGAQLGDNLRAFGEEVIDRVRD